MRKVNCFLSTKNAPSPLQLVLFLTQHFSGILRGLKLSKTSTTIFSPSGLVQTGLHF